MELVRDKIPFFLDKNYHPLRLPTQYLGTLLLQSPRTMRAYSYALLHWLAYCEDRRMAWQCAKPLDVLRYRDSLSSKNGTRNYRIERLRHFYAWCRPFGVVSPFGVASPSQRTKRKRSPFHMPVQETEVRLVSVRQVGRFCTALSERNALIAETILYSGLRRSEVLAMRRSVLLGLPDRDGMVPFFVCGKGNKERKAWIPVHLQRKLVEWTRSQPTSPWLFHRNGNPLCPDTIGAAFRKARLATGVPVHAHLLRHMFATQRLAALERRGRGARGMNAALKRVQMQLGHAHISTTARYLHMMDSEMDSDDYAAHVEGIAADLRKGAAS